MGEGKQAQAEPRGGTQLQRWLACDEDGELGGVELQPPHHLIKLAQHTLTKAALQPGLVEPYRERAESQPARSGFDWR